MTLAARYMTSLRMVLTHQAGSPVSISFVALGAPPYFRTKRLVRFFYFQSFFVERVITFSRIAIAGAFFRLSLIFILSYLSFVCFPCFRPTAR
jgi:hypothetical protein